MIVGTLGALLLTGSLPGCSGAAGLDSPDAGRTAIYQPGQPYLDVEAVWAPEGDRIRLDVYASLAPQSLVFVQSDSAYVARYDLSVRLRDARSRSTVVFEGRSDTLRTDRVESVRDLDRAHHRVQFFVEPNRYVVEVTLDDLGSDERVVRRQRIETARAGTGLWLGRPLFYERDGYEHDDQPIIALHVPQGEAPRYILTPYRNLPLDSFTEVGMYRLMADTSVAYPPFWLTAARGSLVYRGLDDDLANADTLLFRRDMIGERGTDYAVPLPDMPPGIYRYVVTVRDAAGTLLAEQSRDLSVHSPAFPQIETLGELVDALDYIAYPRELDFIRAGTTPRERRLRFDAFWGALVEDRQVAANLLRQYYERVEEANLRFTTVKPGWKTDRGMIYVVFGAPSYVEQTFEGEVWHYGYDDDAASTFAFERVGAGDDGLFDHVVLLRQPHYERAWTRAVARWRRGQVR